MNDSNHTLPLPDELIERAARELGATVTSAQMLAGGYTPQHICRLGLADGRSAVLKTVGPNKHSEQQPVWTEVLGNEIAVYRATPQLARWRPRFLGSFEEGGWVALLLEDLSEAQRVPPWTPDALSATARGLAEMHAATLGGSSEGKTRLREDTLKLLAQIRERGRRPGDLPRAWDRDAWWQWLGDAVGAAEATAGAAELVGDAPHCFIHFDVRSDNMFLRDGELVLIDWSSATWRSPFLDSVYWALGVEVEGGPSALCAHEEYLERAGFASHHGLENSLSFCVAYFVNGLQTATAPTAVQAIRLRFLTPTLRWFAEAHNLPALPVA